MANPQDIFTQELSVRAIVPEPVAPDNTMLVKKPGTGMKDYVPLKVGDNLTIADDGSGNKTLNATGGSGSSTLTNVILVDAATGHNDGNPLTTKATIQGAMNAIGSAANVTEFNDATKRAYVVDLAPAVYTEDIVVKFRPYIKILLNGSQIVGQITQDWTGQSALVSGDISQTILSIAGQGDVRPGYHPLNHQAYVGVTGNINIVTVHTLSQLQLSDMVLDGSINFGQSGGAGFNQLFLRDVSITGYTYQTSSTSLLEVFARNSAIAKHDDTNGIGGFSGSAVILACLENVLVSGFCFITSGDQPWMLINTRFISSSSNDITGVTSAIYCDNLSYAQFLDNFTSGHRGSSVFHPLECLMHSVTQNHLPKSLGGDVMGDSNAVDNGSSLEYKITVPPGNIGNVCQPIIGTLDSLSPVTSSSLNSFILKTKTHDADPMQVLALTHEIVSEWSGETVIGALAYLQWMGDSFNDYQLVFKGDGSVAFANGIDVTGVDSGTSNVVDVLNINHDSAGSPVAGFGAGILFFEKGGPRSRIRSERITAGVNKIVLSDYGIGDMLTCDPSIPNVNTNYDLQSRSTITAATELKTNNPYGSKNSTDILLSLEKHSSDPAEIGMAIEQNHQIYSTCGLIKSMSIKSELVTADGGECKTTISNWTENIETPMITMSKDGVNIAGEFVTIVKGTTGTGSGGASYIALPVGFDVSKVISATAIVFDDSNNPIPPNYIHLGSGLHYYFYIAASANVVGVMNDVTEYAHIASRPFIIRIVSKI